ncbi:MULTISPECIES: copper resistance protein NlpE [Alistipes]|uniref:copper resistance protein NlpE n=1 Tax=Alistipes TaxID=239759 RepID=UPI001B370161|nr:MULTISPECIES: copper resistance protein NlpE [Alistipes]MBQ4902138.1 copper resistance protein NlpE N-terminal domain-containing protein [Alistipes sp. Marseille-P2263]MCI2257409.1 copper resistance protein NlpE [Alistipes dispar]
MKNRKVMILAAAAVALASCGGNAPCRSAQQETGTFKPDIHNAETSLDYRGTYRGVLPAADCPGIETTLTLKPDGTYSLHEEYLERDARFDAEGAYTLHGNLLTLEGSDTTWYKVEENRLRRLTTDRKEVEGPLAEHYVLRKTAE